MSKALRSRQYAKAALSATRACLVTPTAMNMRSWLKLRMMYRIPSFSRPIRFPRGTRTSSKTMKDVPAMICPATLSRLLLTPGWSFRGTIRREIPLPPEPSPPVRTARVA